MSTIAATMSEHHARCDHLFALAEAKASEQRWDEAVAAFRAFGRELANHLDCEESALFPAFESATGMRSGPTLVMRQEHERMRAILGQIELALQSHDAERIDDYASTLLILMQQHNLKEESVLYPMLDAQLGGRTGELLARLQPGGGAPWPS